MSAGMRRSLMIVLSLTAAGFALAADAPADLIKGGEVSINYLMWVACSVLGAAYANERKQRTVELKESAAVSIESMMLLKEATSALKRNSDVLSTQSEVMKKICDEARRRDVSHTA